jgi:uncharacterized membrane protein YtjA (UPF0391 family)
VGRNAAAGDEFPRAPQRNSKKRPGVIQVRRQSAANDTEEAAMFGWALTFLIIALIAAVLGFGGIAGLAVEIAKIVFVVAIILFLISAIVGIARGRSPML